MGASNAAAAAENPIDDVLVALERHRREAVSVDDWFERIAFATIGTLLVIKFAIAGVHVVDPFDHGVVLVLSMAAAIVATAILGQLPTLARMTMGAILPGHTRIVRSRELQTEARILAKLQCWSRADLAAAQARIAAQDDRIAGRLHFLIGPLAQLGLIPGIVMLLTSVGRLDDVLHHGSRSLDVFHVGTMVALLLYFIAALGESVHRRTAWQQDILAAAIARNEGAVDCQEDPPPRT